MPSIVSGLPARPIATTRPSATPIDVRAARRAPGRARARRRSRCRRRRARPARRARRASCRPSRARARRGRRRRRARATRAASLSPRRTAAVRHRGTPARAPARAPRRARPARPAARRRARRGRARRARRRTGTSAHLARLAGREEDLRRRGGTARRMPPRRRAVEAQRRVDLEEVEVRGDADRDRALVDDRRARRVGVVEPGHSAAPAPARPAPRRAGPRARRAARPSAKSGLDLDARDAVARTPSSTSSSPSDGVAPAPRPRRRSSPSRASLADLVGDERGRLGLVELQAAGAAAPRQLGGQEEQEPVLLAGQQAHGAPLSQARAGPPGRRRGTGGPRPVVR